MGFYRFLDENFFQYRLYDTKISIVNQFQRIIILFLQLRLDKNSTLTYFRHQKSHYSIDSHRQVRQPIIYQRHFV